MGLSLRRDGGTSSAGVARTVDVELFAGDGDYASAGGTFAANYTGPRLPVLNRKMLNLPDWTSGQGSPEPWTVVIPFDVPFPYTGQKDLVWELLVHSTTASTTYRTDAHSGLVSASNGNLGTGCTATGRGAAMSLSVTMQSTVDILRFGWTASNCPADAPSFVLVSHTNPNLNVPGLCVTVYATPILIFVGAANTAGSFALPVATIPFDPNLSGATLYSQAFSLDVGQGAVPLAGTQGVRSTIGNTPLYKVTRIWVNDVNATVGNRSEYYPYSLVTRFTHQ